MVLFDVIDGLFCGYWWFKLLLVEVGRLCVS